MLPCGTFHSRIIIFPLKYGAQIHNMTEKINPHFISRLKRQLKAPNTIEVYKKAGIPFIDAFLAL
jgi:hypothetical protein